MAVLSYVHQLFNAAQCQAYIHTLRWKERPAAMSALPEPPHGPVGHVPISTRVQTLLVP